MLPLMKQPCLTDLAKINSDWRSLYNCRQRRNHPPARERRKRRAEVEESSRGAVMPGRRNDEHRGLRLVDIVRELPPRHNPTLLPDDRPRNQARQMVIDAKRYDLKEDVKQHNGRVSWTS